MSRRSIIGLIAPFAALLILNGCSSKESLLVPGQLESDCSNKASKFGVCGSPRSIYEHQDQIKQIYYEEDQSYKVDRSGRIFNTESGKEVIPGVKPDKSGQYECPGCEPDTNGGGSAPTVESKMVASSLLTKSNNGLLLGNRSLVVDTPQKAAVIRDMGWQQKIWVAPYENNFGDLVEAHGVYVVIQEPHWIVGEREPTNMKRGVVVPTPLVTDVFTDKHNATKRNTQYEIDSYLREQLEKNIKSIDSFTSQKDDVTNKSDQDMPKVNNGQNGRPKPIFKPKMKPALEPITNQGQATTLFTPTNIGDLK